MFQVKTKLEVSNGNSVDWMFLRDFSPPFILAVSKDDAWEVSGD